MNKRFIVPGVDAHTPLAEAAPALLLSKAEPLFALEAAARGGADADAVHDMRVASRRLREAMRLLGPLYPPKEFRVWYKRVRGVTSALGPVRDSDVFIESFGSLGQELAEEGRRAVAFLVGLRAGTREAELAELNRGLARLDLERSRRSFDRLVHSLAGSAQGVGPLVGFAYVAIAQRAATVFGAQPAALIEANMEQQHALRIDYKRLRYAVEVFAPCYGEEFDDLHETLVAFQDVLGDLHDVHVFMDTVELVKGMPAARSAGVTDAGLGEIEAHLAAQAHALYGRFTELVASHPAEQLLPALLLPLTRVPESVPAGLEDAPAAENQEAPAPAKRAEEPGQLPVPSPVVVGDEPWNEGWADISPDESVNAVAPVALVGVEHAMPPATDEA